MTKQAAEYEWIGFSASQLLAYCTALKPLEFKLLLAIAALGKASTPSGEDGAGEPGSRSITLRTTRRRLRHWMGPYTRTTVGRAVQALQEKGFVTYTGTHTGLDIELHLDDEGAVRGSLGAVGLDMCHLAFSASFPSFLRNYSSKLINLSREGGTPGTPPSGPVGLRPVEVAKAVTRGRGRRAQEVPSYLRGCTALLSDPGFLRSRGSVEAALAAIESDAEKRMAISELNRFLLEKGQFAIRNWPRFIAAWVRRRIARDGRQKAERPPKPLRPRRKDPGKPAPRTIERLEV